MLLIVATFAAVLDASDEAETKLLVVDPAAAPVPAAAAA